MGRKCCLQIKVDESERVDAVLIMIVSICGVNYLRQKLNELLKFGTIKIILNLKRNFKFYLLQDKSKITKPNMRNIPCIILSIIFLSSASQCQDDDFEIHDAGYSEDQYQQTFQQEDQHYNQQTRQPTKQQMQYMTQRRTACLVLSRYYLNQYSDPINDIINGLEMNDKNHFINKLYSSAVQKCEPLITESQVIQFYTPNNDNFDPSAMFHIFDGFNFYEIGQDRSQLTPNQKAITKFIKDFDAEMEVRKQQEKAQQLQQQKDDGVQIFFISMKDLSPQAKYLYIILVLAISGCLVWYGFSQIGQKPVKKDKKKAKKQN